MIYKITPSGTFTGLHGGGGEYAGALVQGTDGNFYGTVLQGGTFHHGTVFKITPSGTLTTLHNFNFTDGYLPSRLVQASNGNFYGTTAQGGTFNHGTLYKITPSGTLTTLYNFCSQSGCADGQGPGGPLVQGTDGNLYGTTSAGANSARNGGCGTIFKITTTGTLTTLHIFDYTDGANPEEGLIQASDGNFYGTTGGGGNCTNFAGGCGTVFKITPTGTLTTLHSLANTDGAGPTKLVQATNGTFYGTTLRGGKIVYHYCGGSCGTIFSLSVQ